MEIITDTRKTVNDSLLSKAEELVFTKGFFFFFLPFFVLFCFVSSEKVNEKPLARAAQVKGRGRRKRGKIVSFHVPVV